ncbi:hypothetical protein D3C71_1365710 [compost metagenome]
MLLLDFLVRHLQARLEEVGLQRHVHQRGQEHDQQQQAHARSQPVSQLANGHGGGLQHQHGHGVDAVAHELPGHIAQDRGHQHHLGHVGHLLLGEKVGQARDRVEPVELGRDGLEAQDPAASANGADQGGGAGEDGKHCTGHQAHHHHVLQALEHGAWRHDGGGVKRQLLAHGQLHVVHQLGRQHQQAGGPGTQNRQVGEIARACSLAVFARFLQLALRRG